jgi:MHS family proline/betaine transporter-like MFS transporter
MNPRLSGKAPAAGVIGNVLEWYDFAIYGYFAASIGRNFFPLWDSVAQLLSAESKLG